MDNNKYKYKTEQRENSKVGSGGFYSPMVCTWGFHPQTPGGGATPTPPVPMLYVTGSGSTRSAHFSETSYSKPKTSREMTLRYSLLMLHSSGIIHYFL